MSKGTNPEVWLKPKFGRNATYKYDEKGIILIKIDMNQEYNRSGQGKGKTDVGATFNIEVEHEGKVHWVKGNLLRALDEQEYKMVKYQQAKAKLAAMENELGV